MLYISMSTGAPVAQFALQRITMQSWFTQNSRSGATEFAGGYSTLDLENRERASSKFPRAAFAEFSIRTAVVRSTTADAH